MATTFTIQSAAYQGRYLKLTCTQSKNVSTNTSTISWKLESTGGSSNYYSTGATTVTIGGNQVYHSSRVSWDTKVFPAATGSASGTTTVQHNSSGEASISVSLSTAIFTTTITTVSGTWALDTIPRAATLVSTPSFNDEENPTIYYSNPAGTNVTSLQACISLDGTKDDIAYRELNKVGTSYTFYLTDAERAVLRNATLNGSTSRTVKFFLKTVIDGVTYYRNSGNQTFTVINCMPTLSPTAIDVDSYTVDTTGDKNKFIKYYSDAKVDSGAAAYKGASIVSQKIVCGHTMLGAGSGTFTNVESATFVFTATDNRGNTVSQTLTKTLINYIKATCNLTVEPPTTDGVTTLTINGLYWNGDFGGHSNFIHLVYRYKAEGEEYGNNISVTPTINDDYTYSAKVTITDLDYTKKYTFQAEMSDMLTVAYSQERTVKTKPVFDWGSSDFNFNVPVKFDGETILRRSSDTGNTVISSANCDLGICFCPNGSYSGIGRAVLDKNGNFTVGEYNLTKLAKAMTTAYEIPTQTTAVGNYASSTCTNAILIGNTLRCRFGAVRSSATDTGNIINEKVVNFRIEHEGKIKNAYFNTFVNGITGGLAQFYVNDIANQDNTLTFTVYLAATGGAYSEFLTYFTLPVTINLDAY